MVWGNLDTSLLFFELELLCFNRHVMQGIWIDCLVPTKIPLCRHSTPMTIENDSSNMNM